MLTTLLSVIVLISIIAILLFALKLIQDSLQKGIQETRSNLKS